MLVAIKPKGLNRSQNQLKSRVTEGGESKQDSQNQLKSHVTEGGEP
jgi:hypothetical protein